MIVKTSGHQHLFEKETTIKVPLRREKAGIVGHDIIKQRECKCACHENKPPMNTNGLARDKSN